MWTEQLGLSWAQMSCWHSDITGSDGCCQNVCVHARNHKKQRQMREETRPRQWERRKKPKFYCVSEMQVHQLQPLNNRKSCILMVVVWKRTCWHAGVSQRATSPSLTSTILRRWMSLFCQSAWVTRPPLVPIQTEELPALTKTTFTHGRCYVE